MLSTSALRLVKFLNWKATSSWRRRRRQKKRFNIVSGFCNYFLRDFIHLSLQTMTNEHLMILCRTSRSFVYCWIASAAECTIEKKIMLIYYQRCWFNRMWDKTLSFPDSPFLRPEIVKGFTKVTGHRNLSPVWTSIINSIG